MHTLSSGSKRTLHWCTAEETQDLYSRHLSSCAPPAQAAQSTTIRLTMPQHTQHSLIHVLLLWTTILSIIQIVFITYFFTNQHHSMSQNTSAVEPEQAQSLPRHGCNLGKMLNFVASETKVSPTGANNITWSARNPDIDLIKEEKEVLIVMKDGYYFLNLQVTLMDDASTELGVSLFWNKNAILQGWIKQSTKTTGLLGKVETLSAGGKLRVSINPVDPKKQQTFRVDNSETVTHLGFMYMKKE
ncbi:uncharacterized protein LOC113160209 isoform X2 [Anabas testudineus]|uniref:uncharacterized protein LOC113160209 isoform X2 n=1 Tax=Anabas testudineus TaxID=64144 RepID=UPI000E4598EF|nr:uncharacterized protein LOC113160209 isoform X2 [Anabas testudineus]